MGSDISPRLRGLAAAVGTSWQVPGAPSRSQRLRLECKRGQTVCGSPRQKGLGWLSPIRHHHFPCLSFPQPRKLNSICCTFLCYRAAALWPEKAEGTLPVPPLQQGGAHYTHRILNEMGRELVQPWSSVLLLPPHLSLFGFTIRQVLPVTRETQGCTVRPGAEYICWAQSKSHPRMRGMEQEWSLCTGLCLFALGGFLLLIFSSQAQSGT